MRPASRPMSSDFPKDVGDCRGGGDIGIFLGHIEQVDRMRHPAAVVDALFRDRDTEIVGKRIDHACAYAAAGGAAGHDQGVCPEVDQVAGQRRGEERAGSAP